MDWGGNSPVFFVWKRMTISASIVADSISPEGIRLTTLQLRYPRFIHAEFMTHRDFSRNASSSRAIPVSRMIEDLRRDPAIPTYWGSNKPGMQAGAELTDQDLIRSKNDWLQAMELMLDYAEVLVEYGLHKQIANRILEPWAHINVVVTATNWANFYALRRHEDAQPEIKALADAMWEAQEASTPELLQAGDWHLPYINHDDHEICLNYGNTTDTSWLETLKKVSVARCARVSYLTHDGRPTTIEEDLALYEKLVVAQPLHASPAEHQATPDTYPHYETTLIDGDKEELIKSDIAWDHPKLHGNFSGWLQYRKLLPNEYVLR